MRNAVSFVATLLAVAEGRGTLQAHVASSGAPASAAQPLPAAEAHEAPARPGRRLVRSHKDELGSSSLAELLSDDRADRPDVLQEMTAAERSELEQNTFSDGLPSSGDYPADEVAADEDRSTEDLDFDDLPEDSDPSGTAGEYEHEDPIEMELSLENVDPSLLEPNEPFASQIGDDREWDPEAAELTEVEDEAVLEEDRVELMARGRLEMSEGQKARFSDCGAYGQVCNCVGVAMLGSGTSWMSMRTNGTVLCDGATFGDASGDKTKTCRCYDTKWCEANKPTDGIEYKTDTAHRRRTLSGVQGVDSHQRRRWCGWGPRDCLWASWSEYGSCTVSCGGGTKTRSRVPSEKEANGGSCTGDQAETVACNTDPCPAER
eukprot:SRR837773.3412.p2 GENE.SRR837773.3412~~SRR837773.3412.p2  ORF type:complete len:376 (-),score=107.68 SRR837773.3412:10-1137(-)